MLKINSITNNNNMNYKKGLQSNKPEFFVSKPNFATIKKDIFELQNKLERESKIHKNILDIAFFGKQKKNRFEQGYEIASNLNKIMKDKVGAISTKEFKNELNNITDKNIIPTIKAYNRISPDSSLIGDICKERTNSKQIRIDAVTNLTNRLINLGDKAGVQTKHYKDIFDKELQAQFDSLLPVKTNHLDKISGALVQAIENKNLLSEDEKKLIQSSDIKDTQEYTTKTLKASVTKARNSMQQQADYDGWSAKLGEQIRKLWNSENQKELVHKDIDKFDNQISELNSLTGTKEYNKKFKEIFDVDYDAELIATFKQKEEKYIAASVCSAVENNFKSNLRDLLTNKPYADKYIMPASAVTGTLPVKTETKEEMFERNLNAFAEFVGKGDIEDGKKQIEKTMKTYKINDKSTQEEKFTVLKRMANRYARRLNQNTKNALDRKNLTEMKQEYDNSYYAAFGVKNDIAKRVEDYRNSQMLSETLVQDTILSSASIPIWICTAGTGIIPTLKIAAMHSAADLAVYGSDRLSSKQGMQEKDIKEILKWTAVDGATAIANQLCYKGIEALTSPIAKISGKAAQLTDFALATATDIAIDSGMEYLATGKITLQGVVYSVTFSAAGYIIDMKVDDAQRKTL